MLAPKLNVNGKVVKAKEPKIKIWRKLVKLQNNEADLNTEEGLDILIDFFAEVFDITTEEVENNVELGDFFGLFGDIGQWIAETVEKKSNQIKNK